MQPAELTRLAAIIAMASLVVAADGRREIPAALAATAGVCDDCHDATNDHVSDWLNGYHARVGVGCATCHPNQLCPPDGTSVTRVAAELCGRCHAEVYRLFRVSGLAGGTGKRPTCPTCHSTEGSNTLAGEEIRQRCAECHNSESEIGHADLPERAQSLLRDLARVSLSRVLVRQEIVRRQQSGLPTAGLQRRLERIESIVGDPGLEWHRFDLHTVEATTRAAIRDLEGIYADLVQ